MISDTTVKCVRLKVILYEAEQYKLAADRNHKICTWDDYEYFKHKLYQADGYGYEGQLAKALGL